ncbi:hypothetical protein CB1_001326026 [Camelus ferus]|nr:hypothetical protein CB1_001326026 [Camelus ferus]
MVPGMLFFAGNSSLEQRVIVISLENGRPPDPADWAVMDVVNYFRTAGFEEQANAFQEQYNRDNDKLNNVFGCFFHTPLVISYSPKLGLDE